MRGREAEPHGGAARACIGCKRGGGRQGRALRGAGHCQPARVPAEPRQQQQGRAGTSAGRRDVPGAARVQSPAAQQSSHLTAHARVVQGLLCSSVLLQRLQRPASLTRVQSSRSHTLPASGLLAALAGGPVPARRGRGGEAGDSRVAGPGAPRPLPVPAAAGGPRLAAARHADPARPPDPLPHGGGGRRDLC